MSFTYLKNAKIVLEDKIIEGGIIIQDGRILKIFEGEMNVESDDEFDLKGNFVLPGVIDAHVHFRTPGHEYKEDWESGSSSAAAGGTTLVLDMPNTNPPTISCAALEDKRRLVSGKSVVNYGFYIGATLSNIDEIKSAKNVAGAKIYMGSSTGDLLVSKHEALEKLFAEVGDTLIAVHAENNDLLSKNEEAFSGSCDVSCHSEIRTIECAHIATKEAIELAKKYGNRLHICHLSSKEELEEVSSAKQKTPDLKLSCEVAPHHLFLNTSDYAELGNFGKMNPPLRTEEDNLALLNGLKNGRVDLIATDHAPHTREEKMREFKLAPSGVPGVQTSLPLMLNLVSEGKISLHDVARLMSNSPAKTFRINDRGFIKEGFYADLVVVDMNLEKEILDKDQISKCGWTPFHGRKVKGFPTMTFVNGILVSLDGHCLQRFVGQEVGLGC